MKNGRYRTSFGRRSGGLSRAKTPKVPKGTFVARAPWRAWFGCLLVQAKGLYPQPLTPEERHRLKMQAKRLQLFSGR